MGLICVSLGLIGSEHIAIPSVDGDLATGFLADELAFCVVVKLGSAIGGFASKDFIAVAVAHGADVLAFGVLGGERSARGIVAESLWALAGELLGGDAVRCIVGELGDFAVDGFLDDVAGGIVGVFFAAVGGKALASEGENANSDAGPIFIVCFHCDVYSFGFLPSLAARGF